MLKAIHKGKTARRNIEAEKNEVAIKLLSIQDKEIVHAIHILMDDLTTSNYKRISNAQYNKEIESAVERVKSGKSVSNDEAMNQLDSL